MDLATLTYETAKALEGTAFQVDLADGAAMSLTLHEVLASAPGRRPPSPAAAPGRRASFALHFVGPRSPILPQAIYTLRADATRFEIFIVPVGQTGAATQYEAVFT